MRKILVLGAGHSSPFLVRHLLDHSQALDARVVVADLSLDAARDRVAGHPRGEAIALDIGDDAACRAAADGAAVLVHLLPPAFQPRVARLAIEAGAHMVSASYRNDQTAALGDEATGRDVALVTEMGLDPGIDLMSAQRLIDDIHDRGGRLTRFLSYGGGLPEKSFDGNPLRYCITWNPRNVAMSGEAGAQYLDGGQIRLVPRHRVFAEAWTADVPGLGTLDAYANRDSLGYRAKHGLDGEQGEALQTLIRGTLRWPGYCAAWQLIVSLGMATEDLRIPGLGERSIAELTAMFLPEARPGELGDALRTRAARHLGIEPTSESLDTLDALGFFSDERIGGRGERPADALVSVLQRRLALPDGVRDLVVLHHEIEAQFSDLPAGAVKTERTLSTLIAHGEPGGSTAMARTVGHPAALAIRGLLEGRFHRRGCLGPLDADLREPILDALAAEGLDFQESTETR